jgi:formylmethanofuran dehydrogenase subunit D
LGAGTEVKVSSRRGEVVLVLKADPAVPAGSVSVPFNLPGGSAAALIDSTAPATVVHVEATQPQPVAGGDL